MKKSFFLRVLTVAVAIIMAVMGLPLSAFAETVQTASEEVLYIKEFRMAQAATEAEARISLESDGYIFVEGNLNEGTGAEGIWLGYKTTADPTEAVYDIRLMNTDGGYTLTSMEEAIKAQETAFAEMAADLEMLIEEFIAAYKENLVPAQKAYKALNFFRIVEDEDELVEANGLGYHLVNGGMSARMITEMIMFCDSDVVDSVVKMLTMGIQLKNESWINKLSKLGPYDEAIDYTKDEAGKERFSDDEIKRRAKQLESVIELYAEAYIAFDELGLVSGRLDENFNITDANYKTPRDLTADELAAKKADEARYKFYKIAFDDLEKFSYGTEMTLKDFFLDEPVTEDLYPLVAALSDGEFAAMSYGCFLESTIGANAKSSDFDSYDAAYEDATKEVKSLYLYGGVDKALMSDNAIVGFTDAATRHMAATGEMEFYENETFSEEAWEKGTTAAKVIAIIGMSVMGVARVTMGVATITNAIIGLVAANSAKSAICSGIIKVCSIIGGPWTFLIAITAVAITVLVSWLVSIISKEINDKIDWDSNPMPEYIYDVREVSFRQKSENEGINTDYVKQPVFGFYEAVLDENGRVADLNARSDDSTQWIGLYVSYDRIGEDAKPIKAEAFKVQKGSGEAPAGYKPLSRFGENGAYDLNQWDDNDEVNGVYAFYKQDEEAPPTEQSKTYYISSVYLQSGESPAHCIGLLENSGYTPINVNLTPDFVEEKFEDSGLEKVTYTYLGYKTTTNENLAIRDMRIIYGPNQGEIALGSAIYAECGGNEYITLYATGYKSAGSPILAGGLKVVNQHKDAPAGYEPVNFFGGGPAVSFNYGITAKIITTSSRGVELNTQDSFVYFLPSQTFTEGEQYLGGISFFNVSQKIWDEFNSRIYFYGKFHERDDLLDYLADKSNTQYFALEAILNDYMRYRTGYHYFADGDYFNTVGYYVTNNPYRAIYNIKATKVKDTPDYVNFENIGNVAWNRVQLFTGCGSDQFEFDIYLDYNDNCPYEALDLTGKFYVSGNPSVENTYEVEKGEMKLVQPMSLDDIICVTTANGINALDVKSMGFNQVTDVFDYSAPVEIENDDGGEYLEGYVKNSVKIFISSSEEERPYVAKILVADELSIFRASGGAEKEMKREYVTDALLYKQLAAAGATNFCGHRVSMGQPAYSRLNEMNALRFAFVKSDDAMYALRDIFIQVNDFSFDEPPKYAYRGDIKYTLICEIPYNLTGYDGAPSPGVWVYGTTDERAGAKIIDFDVSLTPFRDGYETVRTKSGRSPWAELRDMMEANEKKHFLSWAAELFEDLKDFFSIMDKTDGIYDQSDLDGNFFEHEPYYFHIKREGNSITEQKPYVEKLYVADCVGHKAAVLDKLFDEGADEYIDANLNEGAGGRYIYLGYSRTESVEKSLKDIYVKKGENPVKTATAKDGRVYSLVKNLNLNLGAGGEHLYLYTTDEGTTPIMELEVGYEARKLGDIAIEKDANDRDIKVYPWVAQRWNESIYSNLNDGTGAPRIYLFYKKVFSGAEDGTYKAPDFSSSPTYTRWGVNRKDIDPNGKYIAELYVMDKETIRKERGYGSCYSISDEMVFDRLTEMGATEIINTPISANSRDFDIWNTNKVYIGYSRTNNPIRALKSIVIKTELISNVEPAENVDINRKRFNLVAEAASGTATLPSAVNLLSIGDGNQVAFPKMYLYTSSTGNLPPITDICIDQAPLLEGWNTVRSENGLDPFVDISKQANEQYLLADKDDLDSYDEELVYTDSLFEWMDDLSQIFAPVEENVTIFYIHTKNYEDESVEDAKPYIEEVFIASGETRHDALTQLVAFEPDGFIDIDLNRRAGGNYVYLAYKRTDKASSAIRDLMICEGKNPALTRRVNVNGEMIRYDIVTEVDLNDEAGGKYLYLYYSESRYIGNPVKSIGVVEDDIPTYYVMCGTEKNAVLLVERNEDTNIDQFTNICIDLNRGARGDYLYMYMYRATSEGHRLRGYNKHTEEVAATCGDDGYKLVTETCTRCLETIEKETIYEATGNHVDRDGDGDHRCDVCNKRNVTSCVKGVPKEENIVAPYKDENGNLIDGRCNHVSRCVECEKLLSTDRNIVIPATAENIAKYAAKMTSSILGSGSVPAICLFIGIGAVAAVTILILKRKKKIK